MKNETTEITQTFKKAKGTLETVIKMLERGEYCVDIMQQNLSVIGLLRSAHEKLMENHLTTCFAHGMTSGNEKHKHEMIEEIQKLMRIVNK